MSTKQTYVYILSDQGIPFYVGMGTGDRAYDHVRLRNCVKETNTFKTRKINKLLREGRDVEYDVIHCESDLEARTLEADLITHYGRRGIDDQGILTNRAPGGRGGAIMTPEQIASSANKRKGWWSRLPENKKTEIRNKIKSTKTSNGNWKLSTDWMKSEENINRLNEYSRNQRQRVGQYTREGLQVAIYESQKVAASETGCSQGAISNCLKGRSKTAGGFVWKYEDEHP